MLWFAQVSFESGFNGVCFTKKADLVLRFNKVLLGHGRSMSHGLSRFTLKKVRSPRLLFCDTIELILQCKLNNYGDFRLTCMKT